MSQAPQTVKLGQLLAVVKKQAEAAPAEETAATKTPPDPRPLNRQKQTRQISDATLKLIARQIGLETEAWYTYKGMATWFKQNGLNGFAAHMEDQASGEQEHLQKVLDYVEEAGESPEMPAVDKSSMTFKDTDEVLAKVLEIEKKVTAAWKEINDTAWQEKDGATVALAGWFLKEQMEEESNVLDLINLVKMGGVVLVDLGLRK